jgi:hypothetical protein
MHERGLVVKVAARGIVTKAVGITAICFISRRATTTGVYGMSNRAHLNAAAAAALTCLLIAGCNASVPPGATRAAIDGRNAAPIPQRLSNISGDYAGIVQDAQGGTGNAKATLAQHGANAGGALKDKVTNEIIPVDVSVTITAQNTTSGALVIDFPPARTGPVCTFSTTGAYDPTTNVLSGSYTAVSGCSGDTGTYTLTQQCHDTVVSASLPRRENNPHC